MTFFLNIIGIILSLKYFKEKFIDHKKLELYTIIKSYKEFIKSFDFISNIILFSFPFITVAIIMSNASILLIGAHLTITEFSEYGTILFITSAVFFNINIILTKKIGMRITQHIGFLITITSTMALLASIHYNTPNYMFIAVAGCAAGGILMHGFFIDAITLFPNKQAIAISLSAIILNIAIARTIYLSGDLLFNGTMKPSFDIVAILFLIILSLFVVRHIKKL